MRRFACAAVLTVFTAACHSPGRRISEPPVWFDYVWALVVGHDTEHTPGYSDAAMDAIDIGMSEAEVVRLLGNPFSEKWIYGAADSDGCIRLIFIDDRFTQRDSSMESCRRIGIRPGMSTADVRAMKGPPTERSRMYLKSPGDLTYWRPVIVTTSNATVTEIRGRVYRR
jgi:hypothetical protein